MSDVFHCHRCGRETPFGDEEWELYRLVILTGRKISKVLCPVCAIGADEPTHTYDEAIKMLQKRVI